MTVEPGNSSALAAELSIEWSAAESVIWCPYTANYTAVCATIDMEYVQPSELFESTVRFFIISRLLKIYLTRRKCLLEINSRLLVNSKFV